ncbi:hypothetical protein SeMB42_g06791 [Synchytrium endobioticum]|nr:hypothetical protein SeMB42_g06791 [Synchytrium endobioticum]
MGPPPVPIAKPVVSGFLSPNAAYLSPHGPALTTSTDPNDDVDVEEVEESSFPASNSYQRATSNTQSPRETSALAPSRRKKVVLPPGHSPLDWAKLKSSSSVNLRGVDTPALLKIPPSELVKHKSKDDLWICVRGKVYNCTRYVDFHPGGVKQLLRGGGIEATALFLTVHPWVNIEILLDKCLVGFLVPQGSVKS